MHKYNTRLNLFMKFDIFMNYINSFTFIDALDILFVIIIIITILRFLSKTRGIQIARGLVLLYIFRLLGYIFNLNLAGELFEILYTLLFFSLPVIFQKEIRIALEQFGSFSIFKRTSSEDIDTINKISSMVEDFSKEKVGSLIVLEQSTSLNEYTMTGTALNSLISCDLFESIFKNQSALHDGAVIIKENRIIAAKCILPLSDSTYNTFNIGTRHRAALGISEQSDSIAIVSSEETGRISIAYKGHLYSMENYGELKRTLIDFLNAAKV